MTTNNDGTRPLPPGVKRQWKTLADGTRKKYLYHRATGRPLIGEPESLQFKTAYRDAERAAARPAPTERERFTALLDEFLRSPEHTRLAEGTRHNQRKAIDLMRARFPHVNVGDLDTRNFRAEVYVWRDEMVGTPASADLRIGVLSRVLNWAERRGKIDTNQVSKVERLTSGKDALFPRESRSEITWTPEERQALTERGGERWRKVLLLERFTAARESDLVRLDRAWIDDDGWLTFTPQKTARKTRVTVSLPTFALAPFAELLEELPKSGLLLPTSRGGAWSADSLRSLFYKLRRKVFGQGFDKTFHDFRGTTSTELSDAGCTESELATVMGWAIGGGDAPMSKNYVKRTRQLALNAYNKWQAAAFTEKGIVVPIRRS